MAASATWVLLVGVSFFCLWAMQYTADMLDAVLVRAAAFGFLAAGFVGGAGWVGGALDKVFNTANTAGNEVVRSGTGTVMGWLFWFFLCAMWLLCILPEKWFKKDVPDWLSVSGLILPAGAATVPGPAGDFMTQAMQFCADLVTSPVRNLFGG